MKEIFSTAPNSGLIQVLERLTTTLDNFLLDDKKRHHHYLMRLHIAGNIVEERLLGAL
jgi:hypothetical protein